MLKMSGRSTSSCPGRGGADQVRGEPRHHAGAGGWGGVCHTYVDKTASSTTRWPSSTTPRCSATVCNALDTILVHAEIAERFLKLVGAGIRPRPGSRCTATLSHQQMLKGTPSLKIVPATDKDWGKEYLALIAAVKVVKSIDEALEHIDRYGSGHSEAIVTEDQANAKRFLDEVEQPAFMSTPARASPMGEFGLGRRWASAPEVPCAADHWG